MEPEESKANESNEVNPEQKIELPRLIIQMNENGSITVSGPINDKILSFGMLEGAKDAIRDHIHKSQQALLVQPNGNKHGLLNYLRNGKR